jgi:Tol biopolymer transport system component
VLFEILTGQQAFPGETLSDTIGAILHKEPAWGALPASVPPRVRELLGRCLEKDTRLRLRDIGDARHELDAPSAETPLINRAAAASAGGSWFAWAFAAAATVVAGAAIVWGLRSGSAPNQIPHLSPAVRVTNTPSDEFGPAISPDGKWVAYYANVNGRSDLMVKFLDNGSISNLTKPLNVELPVRTGVGGVAISPDGSQITFAARPDPTFPQYDTWVMPGPIGGMPRKLIAGIPSVQWSPDGKLLAFTVPGSMLGDSLAVSSSDGTGQRTLVEHEGGRHIHWPAWSRDGQYVYFIYTTDTWQAEPSEIYRVSIKGGTPEPVIRTVRRAVYPVPMPGGDLLFSANPNSIDLGLWWRGAKAADSVGLTNGLGEYVETRLSADGHRLVSTLVTMRESLMAVPLAGVASQPERLTDGFGDDLNPSTDFQSGRLVFSSARAGHRNLWMMGAAGGEATPLTTESAIDDRPVFSPDGQQIAFVSDRGGEQGIWVINAQGGAPRLVAHATPLDVLSWSRDGQRIFFARPGATAPSLVSANVGDGTLTPFATPTAGAVAPQWSPNGEALAYLEATNVQLPAPSTTTASRMWLRFADPASRALFPEIKPQANFANGVLAWSPDGKRVAVASLSTNAPAQLWVVEPSAAMPYRKLIDLPANVRVRGVTWSKNGDRVIYSAQEFNGDIVMHDLK